MEDVQIGILCDNKKAYDTADTPGANPVTLTILSETMNKNINRQDINGNTALHIAVTKGGVFAGTSTPLLQHIVDDIEKYQFYGSKDIKNLAGDTPLMIAAQLDRQTEISQLMLGGSALEAKKNLQNNNGDTAMMIATRTGNLGVIELIYSGGVQGISGIDLNLKNRVYSQTALMIAAKAGYVNIVKFLINKGADPNIRGTLGKTALDFAVTNGYPSIAHFLMDRGAVYRLRGSKVSSI